MTNATEGKSGNAKTVDCTAIFAALETWIRQRPGVDIRDYVSPGDSGYGVKAYRQEIRQIGRDRTRAMKALDEARGLYPAKPDILLDSFRAFSGRLQWISPPCNSIGVTTGLIDGRLEYCTGQYRPTEYRKAAASVLETYISSWRQWYASEHPSSFTFRTMADVEAANRSIGNHWFDRDTMRFFKTRIESGLVACDYGPDGKPRKGRFITSENGPDEVRRYSIREAQSDGTIDTVGEFQAYRTRDTARRDLLRHDLEVK